ncbi:MAG: PTS transporter subunit EIIC [Olsenella sp.]|nr:PTS transporter subunit EIIC [Olsenella sp.]
MAVDFAKLARDIVEQGGGPENVKAVTHCMTRLRFVLKDDGKADMEAIKKIKGVLGCVNANGHMQVVLGQNLVNTYNGVVKQFHFTEQAPIDENLDEDAGTGKFDAGKLGKNIIGYITASVTPTIPGLIAGGILKVVLLLVSLISPDFASSSTYTLLSIVANAPFCFLPIWIAYGAAAKLGGTPIYAMAVAAAMFAPDFLKLVSADPQIEQTLFGLPVLLKSYANGLFPALLPSFAAYEFERLRNKVVPGIFKSVLVGMLTMDCTYVLTMVVLAPLGTWIGEGIVFVLMAIYSVAGPAVLAASLPFLIMVGVHTVFSLFMVQLLQTRAMMASSVRHSCSTTWLRALPASLSQPARRMPSSGAKPSPSQSAAPLPA